MVDLATEAYNLIEELLCQANVSDPVDPYGDICYLGEHGHWYEKTPVWVELLYEHYGLETTITPTMEIMALRYEIERLHRLTARCFYQVPTAEFDKEVKARDPWIEQRGLDGRKGTNTR